jgi:hypothetical protein
MTKFIIEQKFPKAPVHFTKAKEGEAELDSEDGGCALIATLDGNEEKDAGIFVRVQSYDEYKKHEDFSKLLGKKIRVTIEVVEE